MTTITKIIPALLIFSVLSYSQTKTNPGTGTLTGRVIETLTKQPVIGANVVIIGTNYGAAADEEGNFLITNLPLNTYQVRASAVGYNSETKTDVTITSSRPASIEFLLSEKLIELEGVVVESGYFIKDPTLISSTKSLSYEEIRRAPGGFEDVIRALSVLPGVAQADPGRNDLVVRGGAPSENLYLIDGMEVPNINHFGTQGATGGPLSYINIDFIKGTTFSTGGFPVLYGDKISSVLSINLREGRSDKLGGKATIAATQFGLNLEGPINKNSNFIFSARRSYLDFIFKAAGFGFVPEYYDVLSKFSYNPDNHNLFSFLFTGAFDNVKYFNDTEDKRYNNSRVLGSDQVQYIAGFSYKHLFSNGFLNLSLSRNFVDYNTNQSDSLLNPVFKNISREQLNAIRADLTYKISRLSEINLGGKFEYIKFRADILLPTFLTSFGDSLPNTSLNSEDRFFKSSIYLNFITTLFGRISANFGVRGDYFNPITNKYCVSPRFSLSYSLNETTNINFSTGIYYQSPSYIWLIADESNKNLNNIKAEQFIIGTEHYPAEDILLRVEVFLKNYNDYPASLLRPYLILANTGAGFAGADDNFSSFGLEPLASIGKGNSKGLEISAQKKLSDIPFYGILSLTWSNTFFIPPDGIKRPGSYSQNWLFNLSGGYKIDKYWELGLKFRFASGRPYTPFNNDGRQSVGNYNILRLESTHSLDVRVDKKWFFEDYTLITYIDIQNVYNNTNSNFVRWDVREKRVKKDSSIGVLPSIGVSLEF